MAYVTAISMTQFIQVPIVSVINEQWIWKTMDRSGRGRIFCTIPELVLKSEEDHRNII
jgi:hypothetical protein